MYIMADLLEPKFAMQYLLSFGLVQLIFRQYFLLAVLLYQWASPKEKDVSLTID